MCLGVDLGWHRINLMGWMEGQIMSLYWIIQWTLRQIMHEMNKSISFIGKKKDSLDTVFFSNIILVQGTWIGGIFIMWSILIIWIDF